MRCLSPYLAKSAAAAAAGACGLDRGGDPSDGEHTGDRDSGTAHPVRQISGRGERRGVPCIDDDTRDQKRDDRAR